MKPCALCHESVVEAYLDHGMAKSVGPVGTPPTGTVTNPLTGQLYEISVAALLGHVDETDSRSLR